MTSVHACREWGIGAAVVAAVLAAPAARAQEPVVDQGLYRLYVSGAEIGRETFRRTATDLESSAEIPMLGARLTTRAVRDAAGHVTQFELKVFSLAADTLMVTYEAVAVGDSLHLTQIRQAGANPETRWSKAATVDAFVAPQTIAGLLAMVDMAQRHDTVYRAWGVGEDSVIAVSVAFHGDSGQLASSFFEMRAALDPAGRVMSAEIPLGRVHVERWSGADTLPPLPGLHRPPPDYSAPPDAPYTAEEVRVPVRPASGDTFSLGGTLTLPKRGRPPYPAAVMITGSGLQDRDENLWPLVEGYRPFRQIAERLAAAGIAVLRVDDRSFGASGGDFHAVTTEDLANDVAAEVAWLRGRSGIDARRIALIGHSEGGVIAPMLAARDSAIAAIVMMAGSGKRGDLVIQDQLAWAVRHAGDLSPQQRADLEATAERAVAAGMAPPWQQWFRAYDPLPTARKVRQPVLILQGAVDRQVSAGQADTLAAAMRAAGNRDVTERVFPHLNHLFLVSPTDGSPSEYPALKVTAIGSDVLGTLADWLSQRLVPGRGRGGR